MEQITNNCNLVLRQVDWFAWVPIYINYYGEEANNELTKPLHKWSPRITYVIIYIHGPHPHPSTP